MTMLDSGALVACLATQSFYLSPEEELYSHDIDVSQAKVKPLQMAYPTIYFRRGTFSGVNAKDIDPQSSAPSEIFAFFSLIASSTSSLESAFLLPLL